VSVEQVAGRAGPLVTCKIVPRRAGVAVGAVASDVAQVCPQRQLTPSLRQNGVQAGVARTEATSRRAARATRPFPGFSDGCERRSNLRYPSSAMTLQGFEGLIIAPKVGSLEMFLEAYDGQGCWTPGSH
jgi:hypothetical protein